MEAMLKMKKIDIKTLEKPTQARYATSLAQTPQYLGHVVAGAQDRRRLPRGASRRSACASEARETIKQRADRREHQLGIRPSSTSDR
jgi:hypothetical protein